MYQPELKESDVIYKDYKLCNIVGCDNKKHGAFPECKTHFHLRHRTGRLYKWCPMNIGYQTIMSILLCYTSLIDCSLVKESDINNKNRSRLNLTCLICGYDEWNPTIAALITDGTACVSCAKQVPYTFKRLQYKVKDKTWLDISDTVPSSITGYGCVVSATCKMCYYKWKVVVDDLVNGHCGKGSGCLNCGGRIPYRTKADVERRLWNREDLNLDAITDEHINNGAESRVPVSCTKCTYVWITAITNLVRGHGCHRCGKYERWTLKRLQDFIKKHNPKINLINVTEDHMINGWESVFPVSCDGCHNSWEDRIYNLIYNRKGRCPTCDCIKSKGVNAITQFLLPRGVFYDTEKTFKDMKNINRLKIDVFVPLINGIRYPVAIEYDGNYPGSHFNYYDEEAKYNHQQTVKRDRLKDEYCIANGIHMLRIPYTFFPQNYDQTVIDGLIMQELIFLAGCQVPTMRLSDPVPYLKRDENLLLLQLEEMKI